MSTIVKSKEEVILNEIINFIAISFTVEFQENKLLIELDEDKLLNIINRIAMEFNVRAGYEIDKAHLRIGDYSLEAKREKEIRQAVYDLGFIKEKSKEQS